MLKVPETGFAPSRTKHRVRLDILADWIEGSVLFLDEPISSSDVVDALCESYYYTDQDFAHERVADAWAVLGRRERWLGTACPFEVAGDQVKLRHSWKSAAAHGFCMMLSFGRWYAAWWKQFGNDYTEQGELFELLLAESLERLLPGWSVYQTGWTPSNPTKLETVVREVASRLGELKGKVRHWTREEANEAGLDILCYRSFPDARVGVPVLMMQCASGAKWAGKTHTPNLELWTKVVQFTCRPSKAFAMPFALEDHDFIHRAVLVNGLLMDRYRILSAACGNHNWLSPPLSARIIAWMEPRVGKLPLLQ